MKPSPLIDFLTATAQVQSASADLTHGMSTVIVQKPLPERITSGETAVSLAEALSHVLPYCEGDAVTLRKLQETLLDAAGIAARLHREANRAANLRTGRESRAGLALCHAPPDASPKIIAIAPRRAGTADLRPLHGATDDLN